MGLRSHTDQALEYGTETDPSDFGPEEEIEKRGELLAQRPDIQIRELPLDFYNLRIRESRARE